MTPQQFYGWYRDHDFLHESGAPRRDTWLVKKMRGETATITYRGSFYHWTYKPESDWLYPQLFEQMRGRE